jgi:hypothetical protein
MTPLSFSPMTVRSDSGARSVELASAGPSGARTQEGGVAALRRRPRTPRRAARRVSPRRPAPLAVALLCAAALLAPGAASAAPTKIAGWGQGAGRVNGPAGVAVERSSGDLYVADRSNFRVDRFDSEGDFLLAWGAGVADGKGPGLQVCGPAAEPQTRRCFKGLSGSEAAVIPSAVAVEAASPHDIYVAEVNGRRVSRFTREGRFLFTLGKDVNKTKLAEGGATQAERDICSAAGGDVCGQGKAGTGPGEFQSPGSLAFDSAGRLWVNDGGERLQRFDSDGGFLEEVALSAGTQGAALAIDPTSDDFYVLGPRGQNERQNVSRAESGGFTLGFEGEAVGPFAAGKPTAKGTAEIQAALEALPAIGEGNISVEAQTYQYSVTFIHDLGGRDVAQLTASGGSPPVAVTTETPGSHGAVRRLDSTGTPLEELDGEDGDIPRALATDAAGDLYVGDGGFPYHLLRYDSSCNLTSAFGAGQVIGGDIFGNGPTGNALAPDEATDSLYTASSRSSTSPGAAAELVAVQRFALPAPGPLPAEARAEDILPTTATLAATLNPEGHTTHYRFQYLTQADYEAQGDSFEGPGTEETPLQALPGTGYEEEAVSATIEGLIPATAYRLRLLASDEADAQCPESGEECTVQSEEAAFTTPTAVGIEAQWASELSAHEATLNARLDPLGATDASWWLEYDSAPYGPGEAPHGTRVPGGALPASFGESPAAITLRGLAPATAYHYRFAAEGDQDNTPYTTYGSDRAFTTQPAGLGLSLPDARAWEMVSPPDKHGGRVAPFEITGGEVQAAADGEALAYLSYGSLEARPEGNRVIEQSSELARRGAGGAWSSADITPPHTKAAPIETGSGLEYKLFSTDLEQALLDPHAPVQISPYASEATPYLRENSNPPAYTPLAVGCPPEGEPCPPAVSEHANVEAGSVFGGGLRVYGAGPDLRHVVLRSDAPLVAGAAAGSLYEWSGGALEPLSVLPAGEGGGVVTTPRHSAATVSHDGSQIFWSAMAGGLYVRDTSRGETLRLDEEQAGAFGTGAVAPVFQGASSDGSLAFFTDTQNLTEDANEEGADLYRWRAPGTHGCGQASSCLDDLSAGVAGVGESAEVLGVLPGTAEDGSRAFFIARGVLDTAPNAFAENAVPGQPNLYAWSEGEGVRFVARLSGEDSGDWGATSASALTASASPSGRYLAFMSERPLSGYDNRALGSGERAQEVFRYDAQTGQLACPSCNPAGARPRAWLAGSARRSEEELLDPDQLWGSTGPGWEHTVAALAPEASVLEKSSAISLYAPRYIQDDGRVFFNARDSLVPADSNGAADVYEYEPQGTGSCSASSADPATAVVPGACVSLISSGSAEGTSAFLDASEGANDVFFYTPARLSVTDVDDELDVYDARVDGEPATSEPVAECLGEACQPPATAPEAQTPASATFRGPPDPRTAKPRRCPKGRHRVRRHGRARCVKKHRHARKHRHHHHHKRRHGRRSR